MNINILVKIGAQYLFIVPIFLLFFSWLKLKNDNKKIILYRALLVLFLGILSSLLAGWVFPETRPYIAQNIAPLISNPPHDNSFPSDHTLLTFSVSFLLLTFNPIMGIISLFLSLIVGICRVLAHVHYPQDIIGGIIIALIITSISNLIFKKKSTN
jgi:membrane-associated phospholipid phosphatase